MNVAPTAVSVPRQAIALLKDEEKQGDYAPSPTLYESGAPYRNPGFLAYQIARLLADEKFAQAEPLARECLATREKQNPDAWQAFNARSMLGASLLGQKKSAEAEPLLLAAYAGLKQRKDLIPTAHLKETLQRLVQLYEATGRADQAGEWKQKLAEDEKAETEQKLAKP